MQKLLLLVAVATAVSLTWFTRADLRPPAPEVDIRPYAPARQPVTWYPPDLAHVPKVTDAQRTFWTHDYLAWRGAVLGLLAQESNPLRLDDAEQARLAALIAEERWSMGAVLLHMSLLAGRAGTDWCVDPRLAEVTDRAPEERFLERALPALERLGANGIAPGHVELPETLRYPERTTDLEFEMLPDRYLGALPEGRRHPSLVRLGVLAELAAQRLSGPQAAEAARELRGLIDAVGLHARRWAELQDLATRDGRAAQVVAEAMRLSATRRVDVEAARQEAGDWYLDWAEEHPEEHARIMRGLVPETGAFRRSEETRG